LSATHKTNPLLRISLGSKIWCIKLQHRVGLEISHCPFKWTSFYPVASAAYLENTSWQTGRRLLCYRMGEHCLWKALYEQFSREGHVWL